MDMVRSAREKEKFLRGFLRLANGPPSHDTFSRLFRQLDPDQFQASFQRFTSRFSRHCQGVVAIDGKVLRRSFDRASGRSSLHMVSAWGCEQRLVLAQVATDAKSNEITAVPKLLAMLSLKGAIVTADAINCQRATAAQIVGQGGDYALALKATKACCTMMSSGSLTIRRARLPRPSRTSMPATAGLKRGRRRCQPTSHGCKTGTGGRGCRPSARSGASAKRRQGARLRPPTPC